MIKLLPCILFEKIYLYFSIGSGRPREPALCQLYRHTFDPCTDATNSRVPDDLSIVHIARTELNLSPEDVQISGNVNIARNYGSRAGVLELRDLVCSLSAANQNKLLVHVTYAEVCA